MIINVSSPIKKEEVKALLEANESPKYVYLKNKTPMEMQFEVTVPEEQEIDIVQYTKRLIKSTEWGMLLNFRVLEDGKPFSWS